ncbi:MAG TPA: ImmA/IrrE family metallo-endopeptidase [Pyrinomonadaceae bacterium]|nr:ImmA/IrrE family metallo-endopeptidase [Pyrinomonadaceae bacterium]
MNVKAYYEDLKQLARQVRAENGLNLPRVLPSDLRRIYFKNGIEIDLWPYRLRNLRGAFICDKFGTTVMLARGLPQDPLVFTMAHELKHFFRDRDLGISYCDQSNASKTLEIGAEIFASELLFPDYDFILHMERMGVRENECLPRTLVRLKRKTRTTLSYAGLAIKAERLRFAPPGSLTKVKTWRKFEQLYAADLMSEGKVFNPYEAFAPKRLPGNMRFV